VKTLLLLLLANTIAGPMTLREDGRISSPGTVTFEAENRSKAPLAILGVVFAKDPKTGNNIILKSTMEVSVIPAQPSVFRLDINTEEFVRWKAAHGEITVGMTYAKPEEAEQWQYQNLLKPEEAARQPAGEFRVKGFFKSQY